VAALCLLAGAPAPADADLPLRVVTFNLLHGGATSGFTGNDQALERRLAIVARELRALDPDVVALQESSIGRARGNVAARLAAELGFQHVHTTTTSRATPFALLNRVAAFIMDFSEGPAILSRFPIIATGVHDLAHCTRWLDPRVMLRAEIVTPAGAIDVFSTHTSGDECQVDRVRAILLAARGARPALVMGDLNTAETSPALRRLTEGERVVDVFRAANPDAAGPTTWQRIDGETSTARRRVDYILMLRGGLVPGVVRESRVVLDVPDRRPDGTALWPSDHYGVFARVDLGEASGR
jgi:endonuclease/exonuclease/phosphatase family metal-dependent hydrolase